MISCITGDNSSSINMMGSYSLLFRRHLQNIPASKSVDTRSSSAKVPSTSTDASTLDMASVVSVTTLYQDYHKGMIRATLIDSKITND